MQIDAKMIEKKIGLKFRRKELLTVVFTHSSFANENKTISNERLEFLGDTALGLVVSEILYNDIKSQEGTLSKMRSLIVSEKPMAKLCDELGIMEFMLFGKSELSKDHSDGIKCDLVEALIGAIYLDSGLKGVKKFINLHFSNLVKQTEENPVVEDSKSLIQEKYAKQRVSYKTTKKGEAHQPTFTSTLYINGKMFGTGIAGTKRGAEQLAASMALETGKQKIQSRNMYYKRKREKN